MSRVVADRAGRHTLAMPACPTCGEASDEQARFCSVCGTLLASTARAAEVRKTVTVVFSDVADWTGLGERHDPEQLRRVMERYFIEVRSVLERHGGTVEKFIGDAVMAVFGTPVLHEDDALRALRAAVEAREALAALNEELERDFGVRIAVRTGVNSGEVITGDSSRGEGFITGGAANVAERLEREAAPGDILLGEETYRLARDAIRVERLELELKGKRDAVTAYRLLGILAGAPAHARRFDSPMVGRSRELTLLGDAFARAVRENSCHLFTVLGPAGVGKSRLIAELLAGIGERATVLRGSCLPYGEGITFWPLREVVAQATGIQEEDDPAALRGQISAVLEGEHSGTLVAERIAEVLGFEEASGAAEEAFWATRTLLEALARQKPLVVVFDDIHWGEPTFLDLVEHVADWSRDAPILLVCPARPELLDVRPAWGGGKLNATTILLEPLTEPESERLIDNLLGRAALASETRARIQAAAEGNPLFVEEMLGMLVDDGLLQRDNGAWVASGELSAVRVPTSIRILLAARLDRLDNAERRVIERASIEGKVFHRAAVEALSPDLERKQVGAAILALVRKELVRPERAAFEGEDAFRFRHILIRDAAYDSIPKQARAELHERYGNWLEPRPGEYEEFVGYHLEQAVLYRKELGPPGERESLLARRAGERLASAGRQALARGDAPAAVSLLGRAVSLCPVGAPERVELLIDFGIALGFVGLLARAETVLREAEEAAAAANDERLAAHALLQRSFLDRYSHPERGSEGLLEAVERAIRVFEAAEDHAGLSRAQRLLAEVHWTRCQIGPMEEAFEQALVHAERAGDEQEVLLILDGLARGAVAGPMPVDDAVRRCEEILAQAGGHRVLGAVVDAILAYLEAMRANFEDARALADRSSRTLEELGAIVFLAALSAWTGEVEALAGDLDAAERLRRGGLQTLDSLGERGILSTVAAYLAETLAEQGRNEEALELAAKGEDAAAADDLTSQILWRAARARAWAGMRRVEEAERQAREAVALAEETDCPNLQGDALMSLARVLLVSGRGSEAAGAARAALQAYEAKGNVASAAAARRLLDSAEVRDEAGRGGRAS
jgi:predicted ATPase/class 3 adenylate cyclase